MESKNRKSLTVYVSSGGRNSELKSQAHNPQVTGSNPVQGGLEEKRHPFRCLKVAGLRFELRTFRVHHAAPATVRCEPVSDGEKTLLV